MVRFVRSGFGFVGGWFRRAGGMWLGVRLSRMWLGRVGLLLRMSSRSLFRLRVRRLLRGVRGGSGVGSFGVASLGVAWFSDAGHGRGRGPAVIYRCKITAILAGGLLVRELVGGGLNMLFMGEGTLLRGGLCHYTAGTIEAGSGVRDVSVVDYRAVDVGVVDDGGVYVHDCGVVAERAA